MSGRLQSGAMPPLIQCRARPPMPVESERSRVPLGLCAASGRLRPPDGNPLILMKDLAIAVGLAAKLPKTARRSGRLQFCPENQWLKACCDTLDTMVRKHHADAQSQLDLPASAHIMTRATTRFVGRGQPHFLIRRGSNDRKAEDSQCGGDWRNDRRGRVADRHVRG